MLAEMYRSVSVGGHYLERGREWQPNDILLTKFVKLVVHVLSVQIVLCVYLL